MKKKNLLAILIGFLLVFSQPLMSSIPGKNIKDAEPKKEIIYVDNLMEYRIVSRAIHGISELFPSEFFDTEIIIEFGSAPLEGEMEIEDWMTKPMGQIEKPLEIEEWMTKPFKIN